MQAEKISPKTPFKGFSIYNATAYVQNHTLINRGITTIGGSTVPQCVMSNNKHEATERAIMGSIYFVASYLTPILLLPLYNRHFLKNKGITKTLNGIAQNIIQVPKRFLTPNADLQKGLMQTAQKFDLKKGGQDYKQVFEEIYRRYNNPAKLKKDLLSVHEKILATDFVTTALMWIALPWIATEYTEKKTGRTDFSGGFELKKTQPVKEDKKKKIFWNAVFTLVPGVIFAKTVTKGLSVDLKNIKPATNIFSKAYQNLLTRIAKKPDNYDYISGTNMSKTIYAAIWVLSSFPAKIISARDKNERRDRALRDVGLFTMFFGGDFLLNNLTGRFADKFLGTRIMNVDREKFAKMNFFEKLKFQPKNFRKLELAKDMPQNILNKTKNVGAGLYWFSLLTNTALIGFCLPKVLNKILRKNIEEENKKIFETTNQNSQLHTSEVFKQFKNS